ncbi:MAG: peptidoglycan-binding protein [Pseudomonadota bacterium]
MANTGLETRGKGSAADLQSRLATISQSLQTLETRLPDHQAPNHHAPNHHAPGRATPAAPLGLGKSLDALRRRKEELDDQSTRASTRASDGPSGRVTDDSHDTQLVQLARQVEAVQQTLASMPQAEAIRSLESGYSHILSRLDGMRHDNSTDDTIDALYGEVSGLRGMIDRLDEDDTGALMQEMRSMMAALADRSASNEKRVDEALMNIQELADRIVTGTPDKVAHDAMGAIVERLVALEARIEALGNGGSVVVETRLNALQEEIDRLANFQGEARSLIEALESVRNTVVPGLGSADLSELDDKFASLARIEKATLGHADQLAHLTEKLATLEEPSQSHDVLERDIAELARGIAGLRLDLPIHEIEQSLLDLTTRVTTLQEGGDIKSLGLAVQDLGERVEACLRAVPSTGAIVDAVEQAVESRLSGVIASLMDRFDGVDRRLDGVQAVFADGDAPLVDTPAALLEGHALQGRVRSTPANVPDEALTRLEERLSALIDESAEGADLQREDVAALREELSRVNASLTLETNAGFKQDIVEQVKDLADRFGAIRHTNDGAALPSLSADVDRLASQVRKLGLFTDDDAGAFPPIPPDSWLDAMQERFAGDGDQPGSASLHAEISAVREAASEQDARVHETLQSMHKALETVVARMTALEEDGVAATALAQGYRGKQVAPPSLPSRPTDETHSERDGPPLDVDRPLSQYAAPLASEASDATRSNTVQPDAAKPDAAQASAEAGDAQKLLRQLSGAIDSEKDASASHEPEQQPLSQPPPMPEAAPANTTPAYDEVDDDPARQRASFIAAARRAAQTAALHAGGGRVEPGSAGPFSPPQTASAAAKGHAGGLDLGAMRGMSTRSGQDREAKRGGPRQEPSPTGIETGAERDRPSTDGSNDGKRKGGISPLKIVALFLFTVGFGLIVLNVLVPALLSNDTSETAGVAPPISAESAADEAASESNAGAGDAQAGDVQAPETQAPETQAPETQASETQASETVSTGPAEGSSVRDVTEPNVPSSTAPDIDAEGLQTAATSPTPSPPSTADAAFGRGFERDRGPVLAETPTVIPTQPEAPPANDLGPLLNEPLPTRPAAIGDALPEAIGSPRLRVAAASGDPRAAFEVARRFMEGRFVQQDLASAAHWYARAADAGITPAAYRLGSFYERGHGVDRNRSGAIAWYERAALAGNPRAMHNLAVMAAEGAGATPDFARAAAWFIPAANRGLSDSQFNLAVLYARGMGVERDLMESYKWFALAAEAGDREAVTRRDEVAGVLGEEALALAQARVQNWAPIQVDRSAIAVQGPEDGWGDTSVRASAGNGSSANQAAIAQAQRLLAERGYDPGPADGLIGPRTTEAIRAFQRSVGLAANGSVDQALLDALQTGRSL